MFKSGGANTDLLKENEAQILFYVDLENEEVIAKEQMEENKEMVEERMLEEFLEDEIKTEKFEEGN